MDFLLNPWVISIVVISVIVGNLVALKHLSKIRFQQMNKKSDLDKLNELDKKLYPHLSEHTEEESNSTTPDSEHKK